VVAAMILIGMTGLALDLGIRRAERFKSIRWGFRNAS
jgi:ABC-type nitrate/sulfonate/bicarbonate transport system permease component